VVISDKDSQRGAPKRDAAFARADSPSDLENETQFGAQTSPEDCTVLRGRDFGNKDHSASGDAQVHAQPVPRPRAFRALQSRVEEFGPLADVEYGRNSGVVSRNLERTVRNTTFDRFAVF